MNTALSETTVATILVVDDLLTDLDFLVDTLSLHGYQLQTALNGPDALSLAQTDPPDLILLDVMMPGMDGYEVCRQLKANERTRDIPVIFVTALDEVIAKVQAYSAGGVDYITKPFRYEEVLTRVKIHLALKQRNHQLALLNQVGRELIATLDLQRIAEQIQQTVTEIVGATGTSVWLKDQEQEEWLVCVAAFQEESEECWTDLRVRVGQGVAGWVAQTGQSATIADPANDTRFFSGIDKQTGFCTESLLAVPLQLRDRVIGVLEVVNKLNGTFDVNDLELVETIAASAAIAIDNTWLVEALHQHAVDLEHTNAELQEALDKVKILTGLLPICSGCKKIRNDHGYWEQVEIYIASHSDAEFSHGLCPECIKKLYPDLYGKLVERRQAILQALTDLGRADLETIATAVKLPESNTLNRLHDMAAEGLIKRVDVAGQTFYELPTEP
ncbi:MAG: response regulator [Anaerolineae bacterium]|nr:response regulator [Anaerolineae bacterium]